MDPADAATSSITSKGQATIPKALRQQFGLARGSRVSFALVGDHAEDAADAQHHASCRGCASMASFDVRGFVRRIRQLNLAPRLFVPAGT